jgi:hypothetical protein
MAARDPEATKARIFAAATVEFAAYGIAGARIARNAQANKQLIYAYSARLRSAAVAWSYLSQVGGCGAS